MTRGMFTASIAVVAALAIPASSGLVNPLADQAGTANLGDARVAVATTTVPAVAEAPAPSAPAVTAMNHVPRDTTARPTLSMVPRNPKLQSRLRALLPPGLTVRQAARGFVDQSQFVSAVHVSRNLDIPFDKLKAKIVEDRMSLGQAIQVMRPDANVWRELTRARDETTRDIR